MATTSVQIVVIIVLVSNLAIIYLPFSKIKKACLSLIVFFGACLCAAYINGQQGAIPLHIVKVAHNQEAQKAMMARFNIAEASMDRELHPEPVELRKPTTVELVTVMVGSMALIAILLTPFALAIVKDKKGDDAKKAYNLAWTCNVLACAFVLSLYYGLELIILPWRKKMSEKMQIFSTLPKKELV